MNYQSTRAGGESVTSAQAIVKGLSTEGGLFTPEALPEFLPRDIEKMVGMTYRQRAVEVLGRFLTDFTADQLEDCVAAAYGGGKFPVDTAPLARAGQANVLELFHGPTCAFKDFALQLMPHLLTASVKKTGRSEDVVILVATSGDTGKAAMEGFADVAGTRICVFYPHGAVSGIQRRQMTTQKGQNVMVYAVKGNFDDAQSGVKRIFTDRDYSARLAGRGMAFSSANSINWGRLAPQIAYYFSAYCDMVAGGRVKLGDKVNFSVPTGNFGNILAGWIAGQCGLPVGKLICASNQNNVLTDFIKTGTYDRNRDFYVTASPSMDILISSNLERLLYLMYNRDWQAIAQLMDSLAKNGKYTVSREVAQRIGREFEAGYADDGQTLETIGQVWKEHGYLCDTHTAVAYKVWQDYARRTGDNTPTVVVSTASPFKFAGSVLEALGQAVPDDDFAMLAALEEISGQGAPRSLKGLEGKEERFDQVVEPEEMKLAVDKWLAK